MFQQGKGIQNLNDDHQGTCILLDNSLLQLQRQKFDTDRHIGILNSRVDRRCRDVAALEAHLDNLEAANALLTAKVAMLEPRLCCCGREEQPIVVEDGEVMESSSSLYQTPPVASPVLNYTWGRTWGGQKQVSEDQKVPSFHRGNSDTSMRLFNTQEDRHPKTSDTSRQELTK